MEHYQPLSWLVWAAIKTGFGLDPAPFHVANVVAHAVCVLLVWVVCRLVLLHALPRTTGHWRETAAVVAALLFGLHPLAGRGGRLGERAALRARARVHAGLAPCLSACRRA